MFGLPRRKRHHRPVVHRARWDALRRLRKLVAEPLERRIMLAVDMPSAVDPSISDLALFAPGVTRFSIEEDSLASNMQLLRFRDSASGPYSARFSLHPDHSCADDPAAAPPGSPWPRWMLGLGCMTRRAT